MRLIIALACSLFITVTSSANEEDKSPLPAAEQVKSVVIRFDHPKQREDPQFAATLDDWKAIRAALSPADPDPSPANWEGFGRVTAVTKGGDTIVVQLYTTSRGPGAFAIGLTSKQRVYYRGGSTKAMIKAVHAAYERAMTKEK